MLPMSFKSADKMDRSESVTIGFEEGIHWHTLHIPDCSSGAELQEGWRRHCGE